jgi:hypothetical protein
MEKRKEERLAELKDSEFKRLVGVDRGVFAQMRSVLEFEYAKKHTEKGGRKSKLSVCDILLMALRYWRQYPTFAELGLNFGISATTAHDLTVWVENVLIKSGSFALPGKKKLYESEDIEVILVDVTENPIERPKKNSESTIQARKSDTQSKRK